MSNDKEVSVPVPFVFGAAGVIAVMVATIVAKETLGLDAAMAKRLFGVAIGVMLVLAGNYFPKFGVLRAFMGGDMRRAARAELTTGRILCLAGLVVIAIWAFAAMSKAPLGAALIALAAFFLALASWLTLKPGRSTSRPPSPSQQGDDTMTRSSNALRDALLHILHAIAWVCVMFIADQVWGSDAIMWSICGFVVSSGFLTILMGKAGQRKK